MKRVLNSAEPDLILVEVARQQGFDGLDGIHLHVRLGMNGYFITVIDWTQVQGIPAPMVLREN